MTVRTIKAAEIAPEMTLVIDGQNHIVTEIGESYFGEVVVLAETVAGDMGPKTFKFDPSDSVRILA